METSRKHLVLGLTIVIGVVLIFLAGYLPGSSRARSAAEESRQSAQRLEETRALLAQSQYDLEVARLRGRFGEVVHEANVNNFASAAERATAFFDGLQGAMSSPQLGAGSRRNTLETILARRDEIGADLARADPGVKAKLAEMYLQFGAAVP